MATLLIWRFFQMFVNPGYGKRVVLAVLKTHFLTGSVIFIPAAQEIRGSAPSPPGDDRHRISGRAGTDNRNDFVFFDES